MTQYLWLTIYFLNICPINLTEFCLINKNISGTFDIVIKGIFNLNWILWLTQQNIHCSLFYDKFCFKCKMQFSMLVLFPNACQSLCWSIIEMNNEWNGWYKKKVDVAYLNFYKSFLTCIRLLLCIKRYHCITKQRTFNRSF